MLWSKTSLNIISHADVPELIETERYSKRRRQSERYAHTEAQTERDTEIYRHRQKKKEIERDRERQTERETRRALREAGCTVHGVHKEPRGFGAAPRHSWSWSDQIFVRSPSHIVWVLGQ